MNNQNRWWESYLVRYLVGNIFAVLVLFYLFINYDKQIGNSFCEYSNNTNFCKEIENNRTTFSTQVFGFIFQKTKEINSTNPIIEEKIILSKKFQNHNIETTDISFVALIIMGLLGFMYMYIASIPIYFIHILRGGLGNTFEFYKKSSMTRDKIKENKTCKNITPTYIESYKHMREHGNAHGIVLMELLFAWFLIQCNFSIFALVFWLMFGFFGWFLGIYLEMKMIDKEYDKKWFVVLSFYLLILFPFFLWLSSYGCKL